MRKLFVAVLLILLIACDSKNEKNQKFDTSHKTTTYADVKNSEKIDTTFTGRNYLRISNLYSGDIFVDDVEKRNTFFRVIELQSEEQVSLFVEKISMGEEGGNYKLVERYPLKESMFFSEDIILYKIDSLVFIDSITFTAKINKKKFEVDMQQKNVKSY